MRVSLCVSVFVHDHDMLRSPLTCMDSPFTEETVFWETWSTLYLTYDVNFCHSSRVYTPKEAGCLIKRSCDDIHSRGSPRHCLLQLPSDLCHMARCRTDNGCRYDKGSPSQVKAGVFLFLNSVISSACGHFHIDWCSVLLSMWCKLSMDLKRISILYNSVIVSCIFVMFGVGYNRKITVFSCQC